MKSFILVGMLAMAYADEFSVPVHRLRDIATIVNSADDSAWIAAIPSDSTSIDFKIHLGELESSHLSELTWDQDNEANNCENNGLPKQFDSREHWPECASVIGHIYDQGNCGSCWAVAVTSAFADRVCIASKGKHRALYSVQQMLSCCHKCTSPKNGTYDGCTGGWKLVAWAYIKRNGLGTGGDYNSREGCQPYLLRNCDHHLETPIYQLCPTLPKEKTPKCKLHCYNSSYKQIFKKDKIKVKKYYVIAPCSAMNEIYMHGSIVASFVVYEDFFTYKSGIYQHITGEKKGSHAVRVIGWGEENGVPYWLVANSWNEHWGDKGFFKIRRGVDECWFEENFCAGIPKI